MLHKCTSVRHAVKAQSLGVDGISIDGFECAGHPGEDDIPGLVLIPAAAAKIDIPMIASGGFADGRGLVAALALGADGINMGSRFMCTAESAIHQNVKEAIVGGQRARHRADLPAAAQHRARREQRRVARGGGDSQQAAGSSRTSRTSSQAREGSRSTRSATWTRASGRSGTAMGLINDIPTCGELVSRIVADAEELITERLADMVDVVGRRERRLGD